jgi:hypothetical protein
MVVGLLAGEEIKQQRGTPFAASALKPTPTRVVVNDDVHVVAFE